MKSKTQILNRVNLRWSIHGYSEGKLMGNIQFQLNSVDFYSSKSNLVRKNPWRSDSSRGCSRLSRLHNISYSPKAGLNQYILSYTTFVTGIKSQRNGSNTTIRLYVHSSIETTLIAQDPLAKQIKEIPAGNMSKITEPSMAMALDSPSDFCVCFPLDLMG